MADLQMTAGDLTPPLVYSLINADGSAADLTNVMDVMFVMRAPNATAPKVLAPAQVLPATPPNDPAGNVVSYTWAPGDTDTPGNYDATFQVTYLDNTLRTFPSEDYLEIDLALDLSAPGTLPTVRPTDGIRPPVSAVAALLATRGRNTVTGAQFGLGSVPSYGQVANIIDLVSGEIDALLVTAPITSSIARLCRYAITVAAAATVELTFWPEQASSSGDTSGILWSRYQSLLTQLDTLIGAGGGGPAEYGAIPVLSPTLSSVYALQAAALVPQPLYGTPVPLGHW